MSLSAKLAATQDRMVAITDELQAIADVSAEGISEENQTLMSDLQAEFDGLEIQAATLKKAVETVDRNQAQRVTQSTLTSTAVDSIAPQIAAATKRVKHHASAKDAYDSGQWFLATFGRRGEAIIYCRQNNVGHFRAVQQVGDDSLGGFTVPAPLAATVIRLVETVGVYPSKARRISMSAMTLDVPVRAGGTTVFYPGENQAFTASDVTFSQVQLVAKKYAQLTIMSNEVGVDADSIIELGELIVREMAHALAQAIDTNSFLGDGTPGYAGIIGIANALQAGSKIITGGTGLGSITIDDLNEAVGLFPMFESAMPEWYMHNYVFHTVVQPLLQTLGGTDIRQVEEGGRPLLMGYPVNFVQVMPGKNVGASAMPIIFGDLDLGCLFGVRREVQTRTLTEIYATNDQTAIISSMRSDSICHSVGDATNPGAVIGIELAAVGTAGQQPAKKK